MTVCIAANCAGGKGVVVASDRMLTAPFLTLEYDHPDAKIDTIGHRCVALTAGDALAAHEILANGPGMAGRLQDPLIADYAAHIRKQYSELRKRVASEILLEPRGLSFEEFYLQGTINRLPTDLALTLDSMIQKVNLNVSIMLAGIDGTGSHIYSIEDPGTSVCYDRLGFYAIGSGYHHALMTLVGHGQHASTDIQHTIYNVYAAKRSAELAPGVGQATEVRLITDAAVQVLGQETLDRLAAIHKRRCNPDLTDIEKEISDLPQ